MPSQRLTVLADKIRLPSLLAVVLPVVLLIVAQRPLQAQVGSQEYGATRVDFAVPGGSGFVIKPESPEPTGSKSVAMVRTHVREGDAPDGEVSKQVPYLAVYQTA